MNIELNEAEVVMLVKLLESYKRELRPQAMSAVGYEAAQAELLAALDLRNKIRDAK